jgi:hypothetical protein
VKVDYTPKHAINAHNYTKMSTGLGFQSSSQCSNNLGEDHAKKLTDLRRCELTISSPTLIQESSIHTKNKCFNLIRNISHNKHKNALVELGFNAISELDICQSLPTNLVRNVIIDLKVGV